MYLTQEPDGRWFIATADLAEMLRIPTGELRRRGDAGIISRSIGAGRGARYDLTQTISGYCTHLRGIRSKGALPERLFCRTDRQVWSQ